MLIISLIDKLASHPSGPSTEPERESGAQENGAALLPQCVHMQTHMHSAFMSRVVCEAVPTSSKGQELRSSSGTRARPGLALPLPGTSEHHLFFDCFSENFPGEGTFQGR